MTTQYTSGRRASSGSLFVVLLSLLLGAAAVVVFLRHASSGLPARLAALVTGRTTTIESTVPTVVEKLQKLARLETVVYSLDTVIEGSRTSPVLPDLLAGDRLLMIVHGQTVAGIDLSLLRPEGVRITDLPGGGRSIHLTLPESRIFSTALNSQRTRVYARTTGLLVPADQNLESETRARAEQQLQKAALEDGILDAARKNARAAVSTLLYGLGFQQVEVN